jgi:KDO2-lipid IV(A) lauroyltransferase
MKRARERSVGGVGLSRFLQWRLNALLMRWLPRKIGSIYIRLLGKIYFFLNRDENDEIRRNLSAIITKLPYTDPVDLIIRRTFKGIFAHYHEKLLTAYFPYNKVCRFILKQVNLEKQYLLDEALARGKGVILVTAHFGAVEFLPTSLALNGYKVTMVVRFKTERLRRALSQRAARLGITLLDASEGEGVVFSACQALRSNQILITECDEFDAWRPHQNLQATFLGCPAPLDRTIDLLQRRHDSPVIMGLVCRSRDNRYSLKLHSMNGIHENLESASISKRAMEILQWYIYLAPEQWYQWKHIRVLLGTGLFESKGPLYETETDQTPQFADSPLHAN